MADISNALSSQALPQALLSDNASGGAPDHDIGALNVARFIHQPALIVLLVLSSVWLARQYSLWFYVCPVVLVFGLIPLVDILLGTDTFNPSEATLKKLAEEKKYRYVTYGWVPIQFLMLLWGAHQVQQSAGSWVDVVGVSVAIGLSTGALGITFAHELCHKANKLEQWLGKILLCMVCYMHFAIEHNLGHHSNVSTPRDPASSRFNESFYRFYPRTVIGSVVSAWHLEARRLERANQPLFSRHNQMIHFAILPLLLAGGLGSVFGGHAVAYFFLQSIVAFSLLECVNYVEHYGLERKEIAPGKYEKVSPLHSWNSNNRLTNGFLIMLQRHSDHHANPQRRYQTLRHFDESPQLPTGYAGMLLLATLPPLWFKVMNPRVEAHRQKLAAREQKPA